MGQVGLGQFVRRDGGAPEAEMAVKDALMALLADGPTHGYELKTRFESATGSGWPLNIGQVYTTLKRLDRDGLVVNRGAPDAEGRQAYELTAAGREHLANWLETAAVPAAASRDELSMKVMVMAECDRVQAIALIERERAAAMTYLQDLTAASRVRADDLALAARLQIDRSILVAEAHIRWLNLAEQRLTEETP